MRSRGLEVKFSAGPPPTVTEEGLFCGYGSVFGRTDLSNDVVEAGAFLRSLERRRPGEIKLLYQHDASEPIGRWVTLREDRRGLYVEGQLNADTRRAREVKSLMRDGILDGLSIGFRTVKSRTDPVAGVRRLIEIDLWEISIVTFPMLPEARLRAAKSARSIPAFDEARLAALLRRSATSLRQMRPS